MVTDDIDGGVISAIEETFIKNGGIVSKLFWQLSNNWKNEIWKNPLLIQQLMVKFARKVVEFSDILYALRKNEMKIGNLRYVNWYKEGIAGTE